MSPTLRQSIAALLEAGPQSARELARALDITPREIEEHLEHLARSHKTRLRQDPARCLGCGFVFNKRQKIKAPGRCPRCRAMRIRGPWFWMEK